MHLALGRTMSVLTVLSKHVLKASSQPGISEADIKRFYCINSTARRYQRLLDAYVKYMQLQVKIAKEIISSAEG